MSTAVRDGTTEVVQGSTKDVARMSVSPKGSIRGRQFTQQKTPFQNVSKEFLEQLEVVKRCKEMGLLNLEEDQYQIEQRKNRFRDIKFCGITLARIIKLAVLIPPVAQLADTGAQLFADKAQDDCTPAGEAYTYASMGLTIVSLGLGFFVQAMEKADQKDAEEAHKAREKKILENTFYSFLVLFDEYRQSVTHKQEAHAIADAQQTDSLVDDPEETSSEEDDEEEVIVMQPLPPPKRHDPTLFKRCLEAFKKLPEKWQNTGFSKPKWVSSLLVLKQTEEPEGTVATLMQKLGQSGSSSQRQSGITGESSAYLDSSLTVNPWHELQKELGGGLDVDYVAMPDGKFLARNGRKYSSEEAAMKAASESRSSDSIEVVVEA